MMDRQQAPSRLLRAWAAFSGTLMIGGLLWGGYKILSIPMGHSPVPTCVCPYDNGRPPSRQPTEDDYYSTPPGVNYAPRRR